MFCKQCGNPADTVSAVCSHCSALLRQPGLDQALRETIFELLLSASTSPKLSEWLQDLDVNPKGTVQEKQQRIRQHTRLLTCPTSDFVDASVHELRSLGVQCAVDLCEELGLSIQGTKNVLIRRIQRHIGMREGQLSWPAKNGGPLGIRDVYPIVAWYPVYQNRPSEKDYYNEFFETMIDVFGESLVHQQVAVAHGSSLKIDFHIGAMPTDQHGVGVEFKRPTSNSDVMKAQGQILQYQTHYRDSLIVVIFADELDPKHLFAFQAWLVERNVAHAVKKV